MSTRLCFLGVTQDLWSLQSSAPPPLSLEGRGLTKTYHLRLSLPSLPLSAHCSVEGLCVNYHTLQGKASLRRSLHFHWTMTQRGCSSAVLLQHPQGRVRACALTFRELSYSLWLFWLHLNKEQGSATCMLRQMPTEQLVTRLK